MSTLEKNSGGIERSLQKMSGDTLSLVLGRLSESPQSSHLLGQLGVKGILTMAAIASGQGVENADQAYDRYLARFPDPEVEKPTISVALANCLSVITSPVRAELMKRCPVNLRAHVGNRRREMTADANDLGMAH